MVIEDDEGTGAMLRLMLHDCDVTVFSKNFQRAKHDPIWQTTDVAIVDLHLGPGISGEEMLVWLANYHPNVRRVAMTSVLERLPKHEPLAHAMIAKPFSVEQLRTVVLDVEGD